MQILKKLWELPERVIGINERNLRLVYPNNPRKYFPLADDKYLTKAILHEHGIPCAETYGLIKTIGSIEEEWAKVKDHEKLVIKPACGSGGGGILVLVNKGTHYETPGGRQLDDDLIYTHIANIIFGIYSLGSNDKAIIEYCITPHTFLTDMYPNGVPDFRIILMNDKPIMAMLRVPTDVSDGKANLHQGALGVGIDMEKGVLTEAFNTKAYLKVHPDTQNEIYGKTIPYWEETMDIGVRTSQAFPLNYLGVDLILDKDLGPLVMEINVRPGLQIQNVNQQGLRALINEND